MGIEFWWYAFLGAAALSLFTGAKLVFSGEQVNDSLKRRAGLITLFLLLFLATATAGWEEVALRVFADRQGGKIQGMIGGPIPNSGGDHQFTPRGRHYQYWAFGVPLTVGLSATVLTLLFASGLLYEFGYRRVLLGLWLAGFGSVCGVLAFTVARYFEAFEVFI